MRKIARPPIALSTALQEWQGLQNPYDSRDILFCGELSRGFPIEAGQETVIIEDTLERFSTRSLSAKAQRFAVVALCGLALGCGRYGFDSEARAGESDASSNVDATVNDFDAAPDVDAAVSPFLAVHNGWVHVRAVGATTPKASASALAAIPSSLEFVWQPMTIDPVATITSYGIYRSQSADGIYEQVGSTTSDVLQFRDDTANQESVYYYQVRPLVEGFSLIATEGDATLEVQTPPENMALLHRWIANQEVCGLLDQSASVDRENNYRCDYTGPGRLNYNGDIGDPPANESFFDFEAHHFVDQFELGCDYTLQSIGCPDDANAAGPCLGIGAAAPDATANNKNGNVQVGNESDVFYDRASNHCYYKNATAWVAANGGGTTDAERALMTSNAPGLPPLVLVGQVDSWGTCQSHFVGAAPKQLLSRKLQVAASAWPAELSETEIYDIEAGVGPLSCNADQGHPGEATFDALVLPDDFATLPATVGSGNRVLRTGDSTSSQCRSRYGISDMAGNVWEWLSDQSVGSDAGRNCFGVPSSLDPTNRDLSDVAIRRSAGGGGGQWDLSAAPEFLPALGIPLEANPVSWLQARPTAEVAHQGDGMFMESGSDSLRGTYVGGSATSGAWAGRYPINLSRSPTESHQRIGVRCAFRVDP